MGNQPALVKDVYLVLEVYPPGIVVMLLERFKRLP